MKNPLVSIICLCYNHEAFIREAIRSVAEQSYLPLELIVVDDASTDNSLSVIEEVVPRDITREVIALPRNMGNCKAFNTGLHKARGKYVIDLAGDDVLLPERVAEGVKAFEMAGEAYGVNFCDAAYIDASSQLTGYHFKRDKQGRLLDDVPTGDVYEALLRKYYVCPPTMMIRRAVLEELGGYDETLAYEDFDFWVRSSKKYKYCYTDKILVNRRLHENSWSSRQYQKASKQLSSTYLVCKKARQLNQTAAENKALKKRIKYELGQAILSRNYEIAGKFLELLKDIGACYLYVKLMEVLIKWRVNMAFLMKRR